MKNQLDPHKHVASWFYGVHYEMVTREQRQTAKEQNYVHLYSFSRAR